LQKQRQDTILKKFKIFKLILWF